MTVFDLDKGTAAGIGLAMAAALISGVSVFINGKAVRSFDDASRFHDRKEHTGGVAFVALLLRSGSAATVRQLSRRDYVRLGAIPIVGGSMPFILFFEGLRQATPANAAIVQKSLFLWVGFLAVPFLGERLGWGQVAALATLVCAQLLIGRPAGLDVGRGEMLILAATLLWSVEIVIARKALGGIPAPVARTARMSAGAVILLGYLGATGRIADLGRFDAEQWRWLVITGVLLGAYVSTWYAALKRAPATAVTCVLTVAAPITIGLQVWDGRAMPTSEQALGYALLLAAVATIAAVTMLPGPAPPAGLRDGCERRCELIPGPLLFARYAFKPNALGYCGGSDNLALFQYTTESVIDRGLLELEQRFEGAYPYLQLIARANRSRIPGRARCRGVLDRQRIAGSRGHGPALRVDHPAIRSEGAAEGVALAGGEDPGWRAAASQLPRVRGVSASRFHEVRRRGPPLRDDGAMPDSLGARGGSAAEGPRGHNFRVGVAEWQDPPQRAEAGTHPARHRRPRVRR